MEKEKLKEEGRRFRELVNSKGYSGQKFSMKTMYSMSRVYDFFCGTRDLRTLTVRNAVSFAGALGFASVDDFYRSVGIDLIRESLYNGGEK